METFGIIGMIFGLGAMGIVYELKKTVEILKKEGYNYKRVGG